MIVTALDKGKISIDGDFIRVEYPEEHSQCKAEIEARDKRNAIEDASEQILGRRLTLIASIAGQTVTTPGTVESARSVERGPQRKVKAKAPSEDDPKLQALLDEFHGEVIEVIKPEQ